MALELVLVVAVAIVIVLAMVAVFVLVVLPRPSLALVGLCGVSWARWLVAVAIIVIYIKVSR